MCKTTNIKPYRRSSVIIANPLYKKQNNEKTAEGMRKRGQARKLFENEKCRVCDFKASGFNYNGLSQGCK